MTLHRTGLVRYESKKVVLCLDESRIAFDRDTVSSVINRKEEQILTPAGTITLSKSGSAVLFLIGGKVYSAAKEMMIWLLRGKRDRISFSEVKF